MKEISSGKLLLPPILRCSHTPNITHILQQFL